MLWTQHTQSSSELAYQSRIDSGICSLFDENWNYLAHML